MTPRLMRVNGASLAVLDRGAGAALVFVHGALGDWRTFAPHVALMAQRLRAVSYTQRFFGPEAYPSEPRFGVGAHADDLIALIEALGAPADVVAWSYGGHVALDAMLRRPDLVRAALIYEPGFPTYVTDAADLAAFGADAEAMFAPVSEAVQRGDLQEAARRLVEASTGFADEPDGISEARRAIYRDTAHTLPLMFTQTPPPLIAAADLARLKPRVSIAWGELTRPSFAIVSHAAACAIANGEHGSIPGAGHLWPESAPGDFVALVQRRLGYSA